VLTDQELQTLRNLGGLSEDAAIEIETLRAANFSLAAGTCVVQEGLLGDEGGTPYCSLQADAERYRVLMTSRLGWLSSRSPIPFGKQTKKQAMDAALDKLRGEL
jgi:hypothetical protein